MEEGVNAFFPSCERCDECTDQWLERILVLRNLVTQTVDFVLELNANRTGGEFPELEDLLNLVDNIRAVLDARQVETLSNSVYFTHRSIWELIGRMQALSEFAQSQRQLQATAENDTTELLSDLSDFFQNLTTLRSGILGLSAVLSSFNISFYSSSSALYLELSRNALEEVLDANMSITTIFNNTINDLRDILNIHRDLDETVTVQNDDLVDQLDEIGTRIDALEAFVNSVSVDVCGGEGENVTCGGCGGVGCETCGASEECGGLARQSTGSANEASLALERANELLDLIQSDISGLRMLVGVASTLVNDSEDVSGRAEEMQLAAELVLSEVERVLSELEAELNETRIDPNVIVSNVDATLSLYLDRSLAQVRIKLTTNFVMTSFILFN